MPKQVIMPQLGESVTEGILTKWLKVKGERVEEFEPLLEINTDKVDTEVPSPAAGILLDILIPEGTNVQAGALLAWIGEATEAPGKEFSGRDLGFISPVVRRIASENNLDLSQVPGSGLGGRITKQDVLAYLEAQTVTSAPGQPGDQAIKNPYVSGDGAQSPSVHYLPFDLPGDEIITLTPLRRSIAEHMVFSERTSPHVTTVMEADLNRVVVHRQANKDAFARDGVNLTFTTYFVAATAAALMAYPLVNSSWSDRGIIIHHTVNIGMATSLGEAGLIVPVIYNAESLSLLGLARAVNDLSDRARKRLLKPDEVKRGTFTITNHGTSGSLVAAPIINQPQCAILGVGAIQKRVVVITDAAGNDVLAVRPMVYLSLTFDHRILDGASADTFLSKVVKSLGEWYIPANME